ncbi:orotidine-5'-phosphate decarboxylase [Candidatus Uhrbacteria bacterium]|nr:orotidine-5'-phosphate decarboxylase [Candidatus Uhrbacteria bacterium]
MSDRNFFALLRARWAEGKFVCVGLDSDTTKIPNGLFRPQVDAMIIAFNQLIVDATHDLVCAYKPNSAFYEVHGEAGWRALRETIAYIHERAPGVPVILDAKRADIGNTNAGYAKAAFDVLKADAITVHPYLGQEALLPFLERADKGIFVLCRTSNKGAGEFQDLSIPNVAYPDDGGRTMPLYEYIARHVVRKWNKNRNCALVVGATYPDELREVRQIVRDMPILIPGIGAQGGDLEATVAAGKDSHGQGMIINSSRGIIFASSGPDCAEAARRETLKLHDAINQCLMKKE